MKDEFALAVRPEEAARLVPGWPDGMWLVAFGGENPRWDAVHEGGVAAVTGTVPVWPPLPGVPVASVSASDEAALLARIAREPGVAAAAVSSAVEASDAVPCKEISADDVDW